MREVKKFTSMAKRDVVPFDVEDVHYILVCANGLATRRFREVSFRDAELEFSSDDEDRRRVMRKMGAIAAVEPQLVSDCCFRVPSHETDGPTGQRLPVPVEEVEAWPGDVQKWAYDTVHEISPWLKEKGDGKDVEKIDKEIAKLQKRKADLEATDPKGSRKITTTSS